MNRDRQGAQIDRLVSLGQVEEAANQLEGLLAEHPDDPGEWLKLAGLRRALRQPSRALAAVHCALQIAPFDFIALVMRASLLERIDDGEANLAWSRALAQRPIGVLSPPLASAVAQGETRVKKWQAVRETRLAKVMAVAEAEAGDEELERIMRFRSNVLRRTKVFHSEPTHFSFPGLSQREFHPRSRFPWIDELESATDVIRAECQALLKSDRAELVPYVQYEPHEALDQWRPLNNNFDWTAIHLWRNGDRISANADRCPQTEALLKTLPQPDIPGASPNVMFSLLAPRTSIPAHVGVSNARLVGHLPLIVPPGCWFRVGAERKEWIEGKAIVFDDTMEHDAHNASNAPRIVLIFDLWHPDLTIIERNAVRALIESEGQGGSSSL